MDIQVWSDVICPWCYIGKRRLEKALAEFPVDVNVTYRAYQLDASAALAYLESDAGTGAVNADLSEARELGITSVPSFVIDGKYAVQGAQEPSTLLSALQEITRREDVDAGR
jgi:predicted DsbA family dithiol-disulfide isomerase